MAEMTVLIPTYRNIQTLRGCLITMMANTHPPRDIVILNNDPSDYSRIPVEDLVKELQHGGLSVRHMGGNKGWMGAINAGMQEVKTDLVCLLNDDVMFIPGQQNFWERLVRHFELPKVGAVGPSSNFVMGMQSLFAVGSHLIFPAKFLIGFCMVLRSEMFREVGMLDESLPGGDDLDLSIRVRKAGYDMLCDKTAYLHHIGSMTGNRVHEGFWNSLRQQDLANNALIRKHGIKAWYEMMGRDPFELANKREYAAWEQQLRMAGHG